MPTSDLSDDLARRLLAALDRRRADHAGYPAPLADLIREAAADAPPEQLAKALKKKSFISAALVSVKFVHTAPVAHADPNGLRALAESPLLLRAAIAAAEDAGPAPYPVARLAGKVAKPLQPLFKDALGRAISGGALPPDVGTWKSGRTVGLFRRENPPPELGMANRLIEELIVVRTSGPYPPTVRQLGERLGADPKVLAKVLAKAVALPEFVGRVLWLVPKNLDAPVAVVGDTDTLTTGGATVLFLLKAKRTPTTQAFTAKDLAKKAAKPLQAALTHALTVLTPDRYPPGVGSILVRGAPLFFRTEDLRLVEHAAGLPPLERQAGSMPHDNFETQFEIAFTNLDRARGGLNFVSLVDLRRELAQFDRPAFDAGLRRLRERRRFTLKAAEGLDGVSPVERAAGILEEGDLLLNVSRTRP